MADMTVARKDEKLVALKAGEWAVCWVYVLAVAKDSGMVVEKVVCLALQKVATSAIL